VKKIPTRSPRNGGHEQLGVLANSDEDDVLEGFTLEEITKKDQYGAESKMADSLLFPNPRKR